MLTYRIFSNYFATISQLHLHHYGIFNHVYVFIITIVTANVPDSIRIGTKTIHSSIV